MALQGNLSTMSLSALLRWAGEHRETGVLELERNKVYKRIAFRDGRIVACSTDDPSSLLGQFLLARGRITKEQLSEALAEQEETGKMLGSILLANGAVTQEELAADVTAKAEENIYGLFDWTDAFFRYDKEAASDPNIIEVDFSIDEIVEKGLKRRELLTRIRDEFSSSGVVLVRTEKTTPPEIHASGLARSILESVDGRRTVAEILLHCRASEFLVLRFLYTLHRKGVVRIAEVQQVDPASPTLLDETPPQAATDEAGGPAEGEPASDEEGRKALERYPEFAAQLELALHFMSEGEFEGALQVLDHCYRAHPGDDYLRHLMNKAESALLAKVRQEDLSPTKIPVRRAHEEDVSELNLQPSELFLLGMIDGVNDLKTLLWVAPMRELDVYTTLRQLMQRGLVELRDPESETAEPAESDQPSVRWA